MIILYSDQCLTCKDIKWAKDLRDYCKQVGVDYQQRKVFLFAGWKEQAQNIMNDTGYVLPILYNSLTNTAMQMNVKSEPLTSQAKQFIIGS